VKETEEPIKYECFARQQTAKEKLSELIELYRKTAERLQVIKDMLPEKLSTIQDEAIDMVVTQLRCK